MVNEKGMLGIPHFEFAEGSIRQRQEISLSAAACESHHPTVVNYFTVELVVLKEMAQELADLFRLTLPAL